MVDVLAIKGAIDGLKAARDIAKTAIGLRDAALLQTKVIELNDLIISAQSSALDAQADQLAMIERISLLEKKIASFETWDAEKQKYHLKQVDIGAFAYVPKPETEAAEEPHWLCTTCYENRIKSILQAQGRLLPSMVSHRAHNWKLSWSPPEP